MEEPATHLSEELEERARRAEALADDPAVHQAFQLALRDPDTVISKDADANAFLESQGVEIPQGLAFRFIRGLQEMPGPDYEFFSIRFTRCRRYWLKKRDGAGYEQVEICFGFEIVPHPLPPIA